MTDLSVTVPIFALSADVESHFYAERIADDCPLPCALPGATLHIPVGAASFQLPFSGEIYGIEARRGGFGSCVDVAKDAARTSNARHPRCSQSFFGVLVVEGSQLLQKSPPDWQRLQFVGHPRFGLFVVADWSDVAAALYGRDHDLKVAISSKTGGKRAPFGGKAPCQDHAGARSGD